MTMFIKLDNGQAASDPIMEENFRHLFPGVSFPWPFMPTDIEPLGFGIYDFSSQPECGVFEKVVETTPQRHNDGRWLQTWEIKPMNDDEIVERTNQEWMVVRMKRNFMLSNSDWTQLGDAPVDASAWATYRQELRDITTQADPFNIMWPQEPE